MSNKAKKPYDIYHNFNRLDFWEEPTSDDVFLEIAKHRFLDTLIFVQIEIVTIYKDYTEGQTYYLTKLKPNIESIHQDFIEITNEMNKTENGNIFKNFNWYKRDYFHYVIGKNPQSAMPHLVAHYKTKIYEEKINQKTAKYFDNYSTGLNDKGKIYSYFDTFTKKFLLKPWFKQISNYFILIKPISIPNVESTSHIALGNMTIILGTKKAQKPSDYKKFVNHIKLAWFQKHGARILKEYSDKELSDFYLPKYKLHPNLKNKFEHKDRQSTLLMNYYRNAFDDEKYLQYKNQFLLFTDHEIVKELIIICKLNKGDSINTKLLLSNKIQSQYQLRVPTNILTTNMEGLLKNTEINVEGIIYFFKWLSKRRLALLLLHALTFTVTETAGLIQSIAYKNVKYKTAVIYLRSNLLIYPDIKAKKGLDFNYTLISDREKVFLEDFMSKIN